MCAPRAHVSVRALAVKYDLHTHYYPKSFFAMIRDMPSEFSFDKDPTGRTIIEFRGARFFGITPPMSDPAKRLEDMDRVGIDVEVLSLSTPNVFFASDEDEVRIAQTVNDAYAELIAEHPKRFHGFASLPMDVPDEALKELHRAIDELKMQGVILISNIKGRALTSPTYRLFFEEANRMKLCIFLHPMLPVNAEAFSEYVLGPIIGFPFDTTLAVARMCYDGMFRDFPDIRWIIGHLGGAVPYLNRDDRSWVGYGLSIVLAVMFISLGANLLQPRGLTPDGIEVALTLSTIYTEIYLKYMR